MKVIIITGMTALGSLGLLSVADRQAPPAETASLVTGSIVPSEGEKGYSIANLATETACLSVRGPKLSSRSLTFSADADCNAVWPGLAAAKTWTVNGDGTVVVADASGAAILTLMEGDGVAYEALDPQDALVTLMATD